MPRNAEDVAWSEYNHHWAGIFVMLIGVLALIQHSRWGRWARHWPLLFMALAAFLFFRADEEAWPIGQIGFFESMRDVEVAQHRIFELLMVLFRMESANESQKRPKGDPGLSAAGCHRRRDAACTFPCLVISTATIASDDRDRGMSRQPGLGGRGLTIRQQGNYPAPFRVADDAGVSVIAPPSPIIIAVDAVIRLAPSIPLADCRPLRATAPRPDRGSPAAAAVAAIPEPGPAEWSWSDPRDRAGRPPGRDTSARPGRSGRPDR